MSTAISDLVYRCPQDLKFSTIPLRRVAVLGSCLISGFPEYIQNSENGCPCDFFLVNNVPQLPDLLPQTVSDYDFQMIQIPLRTILPDHSYFHLPYHDVGAYEKLFESSTQRMVDFLDACMRWNVEHGLLTFVWNFLLPQQNPMGRLLPRYDLRNMVHFIEKLNEFLAHRLACYRNTYLFDHDQVISTFGRRYFQDDMVWQFNHNAALGDNDFEHDGERLEGAHHASEIYPLKTFEYMQAIWAEIVAMYRTVRQIDQVKLVIVDIDDTLWRGVAAERTDSLPYTMLEGWPLGFAEALGYLHRRGVLLAIVSKNDEARVTEIWNRIYGGRLTFDDFAVRKINWRSKADNIEEILRQINLLPYSVIFIDDNPAERAAVAAAFPGIRTFGSNPLVWRRILLWSPETQVATITSESASRTEMIQAQITREEHRQRLSRDEFLKSLDLKLNLFEIDGVAHRAFPRVLELINKTNQFNTTGKRWTEQECMAAFAAGCRFLAFEVEDRFTAYGLVGVIVVKGACIAQFVMSCRVAGMDVEIAAVAEVARLLGREGQNTVWGSMVETPLNLLCRDLYKRCGFVEADGEWQRHTIPFPDMPDYVRVINEAAAEAA